MSDLSIDDFAGWVGGSCQVAGDDRQISMTLVAAEPLSGSPREAGAFRLEFIGPADPVLDQKIRDVTSEAGAYELFIVPIERDEQSTRYEAVFF